MTETIEIPVDNSRKSNSKHEEKEKKYYITTIDLPAFKIDEGRFMIESAYKNHVIQLRATIDKSFSALIIISPRMSTDNYIKNRSSLEEINDKDGILYIEAHPEQTSAFAFWTVHAAQLARKIKSAMRHAGIVHSGMASDIWRPLTALVNFIAWRMGKPVLFVVDIDFRLNTQRMRQLGLWNVRNYITNRFFHDPMRWMQIWFASRNFDLVLLKSPDLVRDFGRGRAHVKNFLDTVHAKEHVVSDGELAERLARIRQAETPLKLIYFGRLVQYKGIDKAIEAVGLARTGGRDIRLTIVGDGPSRDTLQLQVKENGLEHAVTFVPSVVYGEQLFNLLSQCHASLATPLREDTPRSAFDSMARGLPIIAFDIAYFTGLAEMSGAVSLAKWADVGSLAERIVEADQDREHLTLMTTNAAAFARANTQQIWLDRRQQWTRQHIRGYTETA